MEPKARFNVPLIGFAMHNMTMLNTNKFFLNNCGYPVALLPDLTQDTDIPNEATTTIDSLRKYLLKWHPNVLFLEWNLGRFGTEPPNPAFDAAFFAAFRNTIFVLVTSTTISARPSPAPSATAAPPATSPTRSARSPRSPAPSPARWSRSP